MLGVVLLMAGCPGNNNGDDDNTSQNDPPRATDPVIMDTNGGGATTGDTLTGAYDYFDPDGDAEGASTFRWLRNGVEIPGATAIDYTLANADESQSIAFEVTPVAASGASTGMAVASYTVCADDGTAPGSTADSYVFAVPKNLPDPLGSTRVYVDVSGPPGTRGTIAVAGAALSRSFLICDASERLELPASVMLEGNRAKESKAVSVVADADVAVQVSSYHRESANHQIVSADGYVALPGAVGSHYTVNTISSTSGQSGFAVANAGTVAANVSVTVSDAVGTLTPGQSDPQLLNPGQTIQYLSATGGDLIGSTITGDQPLAVIAFHSFATIPDGVQSGSFLMEQLAPDASLGMAYIVAVPSTRTRSTVRLVAVGSSNTTVTTTPDQGVPTLAQGDSVEFVIDTATTISANQPISVMQFSHGEQDDNVASSAPFMLQVPSTGQFGSSYRFVAPDDTTNIGKVFATVLIPTADVSTVELNGVPVDPLSFTITAGSYSIGALSIDARDNVLETTGTGMGAVMYGYGDTPADSFGNGIPNGIGMVLRE
jgi:hypothetical protein